MIERSRKYRVWLALIHLWLGVLFLMVITAMFLTPPVVAATPVFILLTPAPTAQPLCSPSTCGDLGDAPDLGMTAYPTTVVTASFPTIYVPGSLSGPLHRTPENGPVLGIDVSLEKNADHLPDQDAVTNIDVAADTADRDDQDDGVIVIESLEPCQTNIFSATVTVPSAYSGEVYANVWFDFARDGDWDDRGRCGIEAIPEWAVQNQPLSLVSGTQVITLTVVAYHPEGRMHDPIWMRISLSDTPAPTIMGTSAGQGPAGGYLYGETEDYFLKYYEGGCGGCVTLAGWQG